MYRFIVFLVVAISLVTGIAAAATVHDYDEEFTSRQYRDPAFTTALWDTVAGELRLPPFNMWLAGSLAVSGTARDIAVDGNVAYIASYLYGLTSVNISDPTHPAVLGSHHPDNYCYWYGIDVSGDYAYIADAYPRFLVYNIANPSSPTPLGSYYTVSSQMYDVEVRGKYAYVANNEQGLRVMDVSNPNTPVSAGLYNTAGNARGVAVDGDYVFVADLAGGLVVVDITVPTSPVLAGGAPTDELALDLAVSGDVLCVAIRLGGVQIFDITDPIHPTSLATLDTPGSATRVQIWGDLAFVADGAGGVVAIDISDPASPFLAHSYDTPGSAAGIAVAGDYAYVADDSGDLQVLGICTRMEPTLVGGLDVAGEPAWGVEVRGDVAYVPHYLGGLKIMDISDPQNPVYLGGYNSPGYVMRVAVDGDHAFLADGTSGMQVVDISDPSSPVWLANLPTAPRECRDIAVVGDLAYLATSSGLEIVDITDPESPDSVGALPTAHAVESVAVAGNRAYLGVSIAGLVVVSIGQPANPVQVGTLAGVPSKDIDTAGDNAYMVGGSGSDNLKVVDIRNPSIPTLVGSCTIPNSAWQVVVYGDYAYVAHAGDLLNQGGGIDIVDISDATTPTILTTCSAPAGAGGVTVDGNYVYAAAWQPGLKVFQISTQLEATQNIGRSLSLNATAETIVKAAFTSTHTDSIRFDLTADGGTNWQAIAPDGAWRNLTHPGVDLRWRSTHVFTGANPTCTSLSVGWLYSCAAIDAIVDVPGDQGGWARAYFSRSGYDFANQATNPITAYYVFRRLEAGTPTVRLQAPAALRDLPPTVCGLPVVFVDGRPCLRVGVKTTAGMPPGTWEVVGAVPAHQQDQYICLVPTLADSGETMVLSEYCVSAETTMPFVYYVSPSVTGYSVDNIAPSVPGGFAVAYASSGNRLLWDACPDPDFQYFRVYRGTSPDFVPGPDTYVQGTTGTEWVDGSGSGAYFYKLSAVDDAGNESTVAAPGTVTGTPPVALPLVVALHQNAPNPFGPRTTVTFDLPAPMAVDLRVYDLSGRLVRSLIDGQTIPAGTHDVAWDGHNESGKCAAAGVYLCRLRVGSVTQTMRMTLLN